MKEVVINRAEQHGILAILAECEQREQELTKAQGERNEVLRAAVGQAFTSVDVSQVHAGILKYEPAKEESGCPSADE